METAQRSGVSTFVASPLLFTLSFLFCKQIFNKHLLFTRLSVRYVKEPGGRREAGGSP